MSQRTQLKKKEREKERNKRETKQYIYIKRAIA